MSKPLMIGIYGDSFASTHKESNHFAWYNLLAAKLGGMVYNFDTNKEHQSYGRGASPTFVTYKKFKKYFQRHQINIMVVTDSWRFPSGIQTEKFGEVYLGYNNVDNLLKTEKQNLTTTEIETLEQLKQWYLVNDTEFMEVTQELMLRDIETLCPNVLLIPASNSTFSQHRKNKSPIRFDMWSYHSLQSTELGIKNKVFKSTNTLIQNEENKDTIACHLSLESNTLLSNLIYDYLNEGKIIELPESIGHNHHWTYYYNDRD